MIIKNKSADSIYLGFKDGVRGRQLASGATTEVPDNHPSTSRRVQQYIDQDILEIVEGPREASRLSSVSTPAYGYILLDGAIADNDTVTVGDITYEFADDPGAAVLGEYHSGLTAAAYKWAGDGAANDVAAGTLKTAINKNTAKTGLWAGTAVKYTGNPSDKYYLPIIRSDNRPEIGAFGLAVTGANLARSGATLVAGVTGAEKKTVLKVHAVGGEPIVLVPTGLTKIITTMVSVVTAAGVTKLWNGAVTIKDGGNIYLDNSGATDYVATDIITVLAIGE